MNQAILHEICRIIVGKNGKRIAAYGSIRTAYTQGLFADYYTSNRVVCVQTYYKYANCTAPYPHFLAEHYAGLKGHHRIQGDMMGIADNASITLLRQIQDDVYQWINDHLSLVDVQSLSVNYVNQNATRYQIAVYLADVMHYALDTADPLYHW